MSDYIDPSERLPGEPDLDAETLPDQVTNQAGEVVHELPRTKGDRFQELATAYGGDNVTEQHVAGYSAPCSEA